MVLTADPLARTTPSSTTTSSGCTSSSAREVVDRDGAPVGTVTAVEANPAHDLLVLDGGALVPMVFVVEQRDGVLVIDPPDGLLDL